MSPLDVMFGQGTAATTLDGIYGEGTAAKFTSLMQSIGMNSKITSSPALTTVLQNPLANGRGVAVEVTWRVGGKLVGLYRLLYEGTEVVCTGLAVEPSFQGKGILTLLVEKLEPFWVSIGVTLHTMETEGNSAAEETLKSVGFGPLSHGGWGTVIPSPTAQEYTKWVNEGSPPATEPAWRKALGPVGPSVF